MTNRFWKDLLERCFWTFVQTFLALFVAQLAAGTVDEWSGIDAWFTALRAAGVGAVAATLALLKGLIASRIGNPESASTVKSV